MRQAAQYLRMSTDKQPFSIDAQKAAIAEYAAANDIQIVATFVDEARSGLTLSGRESMKRLLAEVMRKDCPFSAVLVFDVTRWGRFQDVDESAYYEYHCRKWGVDVLYVAEAFRDAHPLDALVKQLKRTMAAEYSRELGLKCRAGVVQAVTSGFAAGCLPCLGFRRQAVATDGTAKILLRTRERKPSAGDRVRWVLGPPSEVARVQKMFADYVRGKPIDTICRELVSEGVSSHSGKRVTHYMLLKLLRNPIVLGSFEWGARGKKTRAATGIAPLTDSLRNPDMVPAIVSPETWDLAQAKLDRALSNRELGIPAEILIRRLHDVLCAHPDLRSADFKRYGLSPPSVYSRHFGCLEHAYHLAGVGDDIDIEKRLAVADAHSAAVALRNRFLKDLVSLLAACGVNAKRQFPLGMLLINDVQVVVKVARKTGPERWLAKDLHKAAGRWLLIMRLNEDATTGRDFYLLPPQEMQRFGGQVGGTMNVATLNRLSKFQLGSAPALAHALSELGGQKSLV